jgi:ubiquinone/menaquinone biosynthesis C-methylase UbiE
MDIIFYDERIRDEVIIQLKPVKGKTAADIGADTGFMSEGLINAGLKVLALDSSPAAINFLKEKFRDIGEFGAVLTGPEDINLGDESVDYTSGYLSLQQALHPAEQIKEMFRILKHGGKAAVIDFLKSGTSDTASGTESAVKSFSFPDIYAWFINAGFRNVSIEKADQPVIYTDSSGAETRADIFIAHGEK